MSNASTLRAKPSENAVRGDSALVNTALDLKLRAYEFRKDEERQWKEIIEEFEYGYETDDQKGVRKMESQLLHMALQKTLSKVKALSWKAHGIGVSEDTEYLVNQGLLQVAAKGGLIEAFQVALKSMALLGDAFIHLSIDKDKKYPVQFKNVDIDSVYIEPGARVMRSKTGLREVDEILITYKFSLDQFNYYFKEFDNYDKVATGDLPQLDNLVKIHEENKTDAESDNNTIEVGYFYKKSAKTFGIIAGGVATELLSVEGEDYPFMKDGEPEIPIIHLRGWKKIRGFYSYALGHLLTKESRQQRRAQNWADWGMIENIKSMKMVSVPQGKATSFWKSFNKAQQALANGTQGIITLERALGEQGREVSVDKFESSPVTNEIERYNQRHDQQVKRLGIPLDEIDRAASESATQTLSEEQRADIFAQQFMRDNADEWKWMWELVIESAKEFIDESDDTLLELTVDVPVGEEFAQSQLQQAQMMEQMTPEAFQMEVQKMAQKKVKPQITLGDLAAELNSSTYFVKVDPLSGVIKSPVRELSEIQTAAPFARTPEAADMLGTKMFRLLDMDAPKPQAPQMPQPGQMPQMPAAPTPAQSPLAQVSQTPQLA